MADLTAVPITNAPGLMCQCVAPAERSAADHLHFSTVTIRGAGMPRVLLSD